MRLSSRAASEGERMCGPARESLDAAAARFPSRAAGCRTAPFPASIPSPSIPSSPLVTPHMHGSRAWRSARLRSRQHDVGGPSAVDRPVRARLHVGGGQALRLWRLQRFRRCAMRRLPPARHSASADHAMDMPVVEQAGGSHPARLPS